MKQGQVYKIHSDLYTVKSDADFFVCRLRDILKKQKLSVYVGDYVEFQDSVITKILPRKSFIKRPSVVNIDQIVIVSSVKNPQLDYHQLDRYISLAKYYNIPTVLCFNKIDLNYDDFLKEEILSIYSNLELKIFFTSIVNKYGIWDLNQILNGKLSALCGNSGVGKSSLVNKLNPNVNLKTNDISEKTKRGTHTTRHCEIVQIDDSTRIIDTPGFSNLRFDFILPKDLDSLFPDISKFNNCKFSDCIHINESDCGVLKNLDKIPISRYESYREFLKESFEYKETITYNGAKKETFFKLNNRELRAKISQQKRQTSRKNQKQQLYKEMKEDE